MEHPFSDQETGRIWEGETVFIMKNSMHFKCTEKTTEYLGGRVQQEEPERPKTQVMQAEQDDMLTLKYAPWSLVGHVAQSYDCLHRCIPHCIKRDLFPGKSMQEFLGIWRRHERTKAPLLSPYSVI